MIRIRTTSYDAASCRDALAAADVAIMDLETTGLQRHDRIVAAGFLVNRHAHILITDAHREMSSLEQRVTMEDLRETLSPLSTRRDLIAVFHNAPFDVAMLERVGIPVNCQIHDTQKLLKLLDPDRGPEQDDGHGTGSRLPRFERRYAQPLNYKLKDVAKHQLDVAPLDYPGSMVTLPTSRLVRYLKSDLIVTRELYEALAHRLQPDDLDYASRLITPLTPLLIRMSLTGVRADKQFIQSEAQRLVDVMEEASRKHLTEFGQRLKLGDFSLRRWIYFDGLRCRRIYSGKQRQLSLRSKHLLELLQEEPSSRKRQSLALIHDYKLLRSLMTRLAALGNHVDRHTLRIHSHFNDYQSSGRVSSTRPNLQQIAGVVGSGKRKELVSDAFRSTVITSRNAIVATPGYELVAFDISQADIRVLAHTVESFPHRGDEYIEKLQGERLQRLPRKIRVLQRRMWQYFQPQNRTPTRCPHCWSVFGEPPGPRGQMVLCPNCGESFVVPSRYPEFGPTQPCRLADDFRRGGGDFYTVASNRMLGRPPRDRTERDHMKRTILGIVNGMSKKGLATQLGVDEDVAGEYLKAFADAYPQTAAFSELTRWSFAMTGEARTFAGRRRRLTAHWWLVNKPVVELFISYKRADKLWLRVVPLRPNRFTLTCWVLRVIDAKYGSPNEGQEIYHHRDGRISQAPYKFFQDSHLVFRLPVRNIPWRMIRRVRTKREEAVYEGYDRAWRQLFNHMAQGGTADVVKTMMLRTEPVCQRFGARLILQIHDELVFEAPTENAVEFARTIRRVLLQPPAENFRVSIAVEGKVGQRFGEMRELQPHEIADSWWRRAWLWLKSRILGIWRRLRFWR